jgi:hypothetical protein
MKIATLKKLPADENAFVLGKSTLERAARGLDLSEEDLKGLMEAQLKGSPPEESRLAQVLEFLIELIGLRFVLHKMGLLLFNIENEFYGKWFLAFEIGGEYYIPIQQREGIALESLQSHHRLFLARSDRPVVELLLYLSGTDPLAQLEILETDTDHELLSGSRVALPKEEAAQAAEIFEQLKSSFQSEKARLDQLEALFEEGFSDR